MTAGDGIARPSTGDVFAAAGTASVGPATHHAVRHSGDSGRAHSKYSRMELLSEFLRL